MHMPRSTGAGSPRITSRCAPLVAALALVLLAAFGAATASASSFELRVEGSARTLYEGPVTPAAETFETTSSAGAHPCDVTHNTGVAGPELGNPTTALRDVALAEGLPFDAEWFGSEAHPGAGDFFVSRLGEDRNESAPPFDSWGLAVNWVSSEVGGCEVAPEPGSEALWAYNFFNLAHMLRLSGPASVEAGQPFILHVSDGSSGAALSGATIGETAAGVTSALPGSPASGAGGDATVVLSHPGTVLLKAQRADSVRSNGLAVCVHVAGDGGCGSSTAGGVAGLTSSSPAAYKGTYALVAHLSSVANGRHYSRHGAPRLLTGQVSSHSAVTAVNLSLRRTHKGRCWAYDGVRARFARARCGSAKPFKVASAGSFSYLLPSALAPGRYVLDVTGTDTAGNTIALARGTSRVVFHVE